MEHEDIEVDGFILVPSGPDNKGCRINTNPRQHEEHPRYLAYIDRLVDSLEETLWPLNCFIHQNPELAFREYKAHQALTDFMRSREGGWKVTRSAYGMETAWVAAYDSGNPGPVVSFNVEMGRHESHSTPGNNHYNLP